MVGAAPVLVLQSAGCAAGRLLALGRVSHAGFEPRVALTLGFSLREVIGAPGVVSKQGLHDMKKYYWTTVHIRGCLLTTVEVMDRKVVPTNA